MIALLVFRLICSFGRNAIRAGERMVWQSDSDKVKAGAGYFTFGRKYSMYDHKEAV
jgi:hypothetical protein